MGHPIDHSHVAISPLRLYLIGCFVLVLGAVMALWKAGALAHVGAVWMAIGVTIAIGLEIMLVVPSGKPTVTRG